MINSAPQNIAMAVTPRTRRARFGAFDVDLRSGEVCKHGIRMKLQDQPFQVLAICLSIQVTWLRAKNSARNSGPQTLSLTSIPV